jgi:hypothetical protein
MSARSAVVRPTTRSYFATQSKFRDDHMDPKLIRQLSKSRGRRSVEVSPGGQVILCWEWSVLHMRVADLLVLRRALRNSREDGAQNWAQPYILWLNDCAMFLKYDDLYHFCAMVEQAAEELPDRVVRWADLNVRLVPLDATDYTAQDCLSLN